MRQSGPSFLVMLSTSHVGMTSLASSEPGNILHMIQTLICVCTTAPNLSSLLGIVWRRSHSCLNSREMSTSSTQRGVFHTRAFLHCPCHCFKSMRMIRLSSRKVKFAPPISEILQLTEVGVLAVIYPLVVAHDGAIGSNAPNVCLCLSFSGVRIRLLP